MDSLIQAILGLLAGTLCGLFLPGIHQNTLAFFLVPLGVPGIISGISTQYFSSIPLAVFSGVPSGGREISVLPAHRMLLSGEGSRAILVSAYSLLMTVPVFLAFLPAVLFLLPEKFPRELVLGILLFFSAILLLSEGKNLPEALLVFLAAGVFGTAFISESALFPVFAGFFGGAMLIESVVSEKGVARPAKPQRNTAPNLGRLFFPVALGTLAGYFVGTFPALTVSVVAAALSGIFGGVDTEEFLALSVAGGFSSFLFSIPTFFLSGAERNGVVSALARAGLSPGNLLPVVVLIPLVSVLSAGILGFWIAPLSGRIASLPFLNEASLLILSVAVGALSGFGGLALFALSSGISLAASRAGVGKRVLVSFILFPTLLKYLG